MSSKAYIGDHQEGYPHGPGVYIEHDKIFEGTWNKGLRVNTGSYKYDDRVYVVKFKQGKIHRLINIEAKTFEKLVTFRQIEYIKEGEYYKEVPGYNHISFWVIENQVVFNGLPLKNLEVQILKWTNYVIYSLANDKTSLREIRMEKLKFICRFVNMTAVGPIKVFNENQFSLKGYVIGYKCIGKFYVKKGNLELLIQESDSLIKSNFILRSIEQGTLFNIKKDTREIKFSKETDTIYSEHDMNLFYVFFSKSLILFHDTCIELLKFPKKNVVLYSMQIATNWLEFEKCLLKEATIIREKKKGKIMRNQEENGKIHQIKSKENCLDPGITDIDENTIKKVRKILYIDGSFYYGEVKNNMRDGLGCFVHSNGSRYKGYFKDGSMCGKGVFTTEGNQIKGIWKGGRINSPIVLFND